MDPYAVCISSITDYGLPRWLSGKEPAYQCRKHKFDPWVWKSPGERNGNPLQFFCLGNPMDRGTCQAIVHGVAKESDTIYQLKSNSIRDYHTFSDLTQMYYFSFHRSGVQVQVRQVHCSRSHYIKIEVLSWAVISSEAQHPLVRSFRFWKITDPCSHGTWVSIFLQAVRPWSRSAPSHPQFLAHGPPHDITLCPPRSAGETLGCWISPFRKGPVPFQGSPD